jgi:hypothetical protein
MTDRSRRRLVPLLAALAVLGACSKPVAGAPVAGDDPPADDRPTASADPSTAELPTGSSTAEPSGDLAPLVGSWTGEYTCQQGGTGLKLTIAPGDAASVKVVFAFFPLPDNPGAKQGSFEMVGAYSGEKLLLKQQKWLERPPNYTMVDLEVTSPVETDVDVLSGDVLSDACKGFSVRRD